jgi:hypothetical protein
MVRTPLKKSSLSSLSDTVREIREVAESDLVAFIKLVHPQRVLAPVHEEVIRWWTRQSALSHQLLLLPRDHGKSALIAYRVAWEITKDPTLRVLYISSTSNLATKQLKFIKDILASDIYRRYWPEMINEDESKREKWTETEISVDHPLRKKEAVRDPTIFTAGLTTGIVGLHCDIAVMDDVVTGQNAYTEDGRSKVKAQYSLLASIQGAEGREWSVGTRYHPLDLYNDMQEARVDTYTEEGEYAEAVPLYEAFQRAVEDRGDGTGQFLWPKIQRADGKTFGFDAQVLATKRSQYLDKTQFRAQYYNDPNDFGSAPITRDMFQYFDDRYIRQEGLTTYFKDRKLNVFAAIDFAFSTRQKADFTSIVVIGVDYENNIYVLDIDRFQTSKISDYFQRMLKLHNKWSFRKLRAEVVSAQRVIVEDLKENYIRPFGLMLSIDEHTPSRHVGTKEERMEAALQPRYANKQVWHSKTGLTNLLEDELVSQNPPHDDIKDCLASVIEIAVKPMTKSDGSVFRAVRSYTESNNLYNPRFGGIH